MATLTFVLGLAGSGKTFVADEICAKTGARFFESILRAEEVAAGLPAIAEIKECLGSGRDCVVEEVAFCASEYRAWILDQVANVPDVRIEWWCFENDLESANWNCTHRSNKRAAPEHVAQNRRVHSVYTYPEGAAIHRITRVSTSGSSGPLDPSHVT